MKITIEFDNGEQRFYEAQPVIDKVLLQGQIVVMEIKHPDFGEHFKLLSECLVGGEDEN